MTLRKFAAHAAIAALAAAFMLGTAGVGEAAKKKAAPKPAAATAWCPWVWMPVCGVVNGKKQTFSNMCFAKQAKAKKIKPGACK